MILHSLTSEIKITASHLIFFPINYKQGYVDAALAFQRESGTDPGVDLAAITDRMEIRRAVQSGDVEAAMERVNDLDPEILEEHAELLFHLQQQRLIELIRKGAVEEALEFAQDQLAPHGEDNPSFLEELERTVALLVFDKPESSPMGDLLEPSQRSRTASELNAAILAAQSQASTPKLPNLLKFLVWAQEQLESRLSYPKMRDVVEARPVGEGEEGEEGEEFATPPVETGNLFIGMDIDAAAIEIATAVMMEAGE